MYKILFLISISHVLSAQAKQDYVWLYNNYGDQAYGYDFNQKENGNPIDLEYGIPFVFVGNNASICDKDGNLLFYTNGCHVANGDHEIIENGSDINYGDYIVQYRQDTCEHYPAVEDILLLPDPAQPDQGFYLIHKRIELGEPETFMTLRYSYIESMANGGKGKVSIKSEPILEETKVMYSYLTAVPHSNGIDWWILQPDYEENIHVFLLDGVGFTKVNTTKAPANFTLFTSASGIAKFSPDGNRYAFFNAYDNLHLFDFDRETGDLHSHQFLHVKDVPANLAFFSAVEWSPDSRFLYISTTEELWQLDTWEDDLEDGLELIATFNGVNDPFPTIFYLMALAPDCKIYMCSTSSTNTYHVINNPNRKGQDCDFAQQGIQLPFVSATATMPNFPRFRVDEEEKCDPTITSIFGEDIYWRRELTCYPNPVKELLTVELPEQKKGLVVVMDMEGQVVIHKEIIASTLNQQLSMGGLPSGTYSVEYVPEENEKRRIWTSKVVKID